MGFHLKKSTFVTALRALCGESSNSIWNRSHEIYKRSWGWSDNYVVSAIRKNPQCMILSEKKIMEGGCGKMGEGGNAVQNSAVQTTSLENIEALLEAARYDDLDDIVSLACAGVSLDSKDSQGRTALHMASANGHLDIVEYLISRGVDLNATNEEMNTPLHWACLNGHVEVVKKLIFAGANLSVLNSYERTPIDEAVTRGKMDVLDAINAAAAQVELTGVSMS